MDRDMVVLGAIALLLSSERDSSSTRNQLATN